MKKYTLLAAIAIFMIGCQNPPAGGNHGVLKKDANTEHWSDIEREGGISHSEGSSDHAEAGKHHHEAKWQSVEVDVNGAKLKANKGGLEESMVAF